MFLCCGLEKGLQLLCLHPWKATDTGGLPLFGKVCFLPWYEADRKTRMCKDRGTSQRLSSTMTAKCK